ncbi:hypothetical protein [Luteibacter yeojuensis]|uniref:Uncharacterized protein n=1 Tax=Luteibacter yeojuensis TaxID=345309 RepID=A0A0F3KZ19_9GAMM|nr:hypothetical protein [Luteibacter yeojuensis]KJV35359.1 hypothetical protein VI08_08730 [Luteibacter yeojuensis]
MTDTTTPAADWPRPYWQPSDESGVLLFFVFGSFAEDVAIPAMKYGSPGLPEGVEMQRMQNVVLSKWEGYPLAGALGELLREDNPEAFKQAKHAPHVMVIRGRFPDRDDLGYLRDTLGVVAGLTDVGGSVVVDPQILTLFGAPEWREHYLIKGGAPTRHHVLILCSPEETKGRSWIRTRGMRKFGRPDVSITNVPDREIDRVGALAERFVDLGALGAHFEDGQVVEVDGVAGGLTVHLDGDENDPRFNNSHAAIRWPA